MYSSCINVFPTPPSKWIHLIHGGGGYLEVWRTASRRYSLRQFSRVEGVAYEQPPQMVVVSVVAVVAVVEPTPPPQMLQLSMEVVDNGVWRLRSNLRVEA